MAHKTLIGGTAYEISGGKTLIDGTAYLIKSGKTLVDGTAYEVGFGLPMAIVRLTADTFENKNYASAYIDYTTPDGDTGRLSTAGEYELPIGTNISCELRFGGKDRASLYIYFNGEYVVNGESEVFYDVTLSTNLIIVPENMYYMGGQICIAEIPDGCIYFVFFDSTNIPYVAENGMTWNEWCGSEYNSFGGYTQFAISGDTVTYYGSAVKYNGTNVKPTDTIIDGAIYTPY